LLSLSSAAAVTLLRNVLSLTASSLQTAPTFLPNLDALDRQFLEHGRVCKLRYLHFLPSKSDTNFRSPFADEISGEAQVPDEQPFTPNPFTQNSGNPLLLLNFCGNILVAAMEHRN
jgi:hypothetical protein